MSDNINIGQIRSWLESVSDVIKKTEEELDKEGGRFNIFSILNLSSNEVRLHSNLIAELLDPRGTHSFRTVFLELFLDLLKELTSNKIPYDFHKESAIIKIEKWIGFIDENYTYGGKIDILISDKYNNTIIIENKITAGDQKKQLLRYYNFDRNALLLYLTLDGRKACLESTDGQLLPDKDYFCISYKNFILKWLNKCFEMAATRPRVQNTIAQYINIIKDYTHQTLKHNMSKDIIELISSNKDFFKSVEEISNSYQSFIQSVNDKFWISLREKIPNHQGILKTSENTDIKYCIEEDGAGFFYGFYVTKQDERENCSSDEYTSMVTSLKGIRQRTGNNHNYICWVFSDVLDGFYKLNKERIFYLNNEEEMSGLTDQLVEEFKQVRLEVCQRLKPFQIAQVQDRMTGK
jgi:hypothetical protein